MEIGGMAMLRDTESLIIRMVTFIGVNLLRIELLALVFMFILTDKDTRASGKTTCKMGQERKS